MKYIATLTFALFTTIAAFAQLGINATYRTNDAPEWAYGGSSPNYQDLLPESTIAVGLDYWIPVKAYRIDFLPELNFSRMSNTIILSPPEIIAAPDQEATLENTWLSFFLNTNIYFLDLEGDCDCPTFSKSGGALQKGLFFQVSPGITWMNNRAETPERASDSNNFAFSLAAGLGLDIGLSDIVTLTPFAGYRYYLPTQWENLDIFDFPETPIDPPPAQNKVRNEESSVRQFYAGLRLGVRLDQR